jgi:hypothetical protein
MHNKIFLIVKIENVVNEIVGFSPASPGTLVFPQVSEVAISA